VPPTGRNDVHSDVLPVRNSIFELSYADARTRLETYLSTQSAGTLKLVTQVRFRRPLHRRSPQRDAQDIGMAMNPHWLQGFPRRPRRRLWFSAATRTQARERSRLAGAIRSHSCDRDGYARTGDVPAQLELARTSCIGPGVDTGQHLGQAALRALQITKPGPAAVTGGPAGASQPVTACIRSACRPSGRWSTIAARPRVESRGYPGQLEGNGPYLVALRAPGRAPGGPGTRPGLTGSRRRRRLRPLPDGTVIVAVAPHIAPALLASGVGGLAAAGEEVRRSIPAEAEMATGITVCPAGAWTV
jgi:hypothetical protein